MLSKIDSIFLECVTEVKRMSKRPKIKGYLHNFAVQLCPLSMYIWLIILVTPSTANVVIKSSKIRVGGRGGGSSQTSGLQNLPLTQKDKNVRM